MCEPKREKIMRIKQLSILNVLAAGILSIILSACANRNQEPVVKEDQTVVYSPLRPHHPEARVTLFRKFNKNTGTPIGAGTVFKIKEKEILRAVVELDPKPSASKRISMFHLDWIGPNGKSLFLKPFYIAPGDTVQDLLSSISLAPEGRQPGNYKLRVYYFRELIAEKAFELIPVTDPNEDLVKAKLTLCQKIDSLTGLPTGVDSTFKIRKKGKVLAVVDLENLPTDDDSELKFRIEWIEHDTTSFFRKRIEMVPTQTTATISSSISITPEKREAGDYFVRVYLASQMLAEKRFRLYHQ